jgi:hypothetical protein
MVAPAFVAFGAAQALATAAAAPYPTGHASGDLLLAFASSDVSTISDLAAGWTAVGAVHTGGGMSMRVWKRTSTGAESGNVTFGTTAGTKGLAWVTAYRPESGKTLDIANYVLTSDTDTSSTAFTAASSSWTTVSGEDTLVAFVTSKAPTASYSASFTAIGLTQVGATVVESSRLSARASTNTLAYSQRDATVTTGATGAVSFSATTTGANGAGVIFLANLHQGVASNAAPTANAGTDQVDVEPYTTVTLTGSGTDSDGTIASYAWTQTGGTTVTLSGTGTTRTFTAPALMAGDTLTFTLVVTDNLGATSTADTVTVTVLPHNEWYRTGGAWVPINTGVRVGGVWV